MEKGKEWDILLDKRLVLLDFDGLLVDTERLHYRAYLKMCMHYGYHLDWSFAKFCSLAHKSAVALQEGICREIPSLALKPWQELYKEKKRCYLELISQGEMTLMPYVEPFLKKLSGQGLQLAVVTHSPKEQITAIKKILPILQTIPSWFTREDYKEPKPAPDGYLQAIQYLQACKEEAIGFEDTLRGYRSLHAAGIKGVVVSTILTPLVRRELLQLGALLLPSFAPLCEEISSKKL